MNNMHQTGNPNSNYVNMNQGGYTPINNQGQMSQPQLPVGQPMMPQGPQAPQKSLKNGGYLADILEDLRGVFINQKTDWQEALTGCSREQVYRVFDIDDQNGSMLLECREKSDFCARCCLGGSCRPFMMQVNNILDGSVCLWIERPYTCTFVCCNRPFAKVYTLGADNAKQYLGQIRDVYRCCSFEFEIQDENGDKIYSMDTPLCQKGIICDCPCDDCNRVEFIVKSKDRKRMTKAVKKGKGFIKNSLTNADLFEIFYTQDMPWNHRALLLCAILFLDFRMFEDKNNNRRNNRR